jgi:hypothetical protein
MAWASLLFVRSQARLVQSEKEDSFAWSILQGDHGAFLKTLVLLSHTILAWLVFVMSLARIDLIHLLYMLFTAVLLASSASNSSNIWVYLRLYNISATIALLVFATPFIGDAREFPQLGKIRRKLHCVQSALTAIVQACCRCRRHARLCQRWDFLP